MASGLEGVAELSKQLSALGAAVGGKVLRNAVASAIRPAFNAAKQAVPVGSEPHKTYKGRLVAPGFAQRSLKIQSYLSKDRLSASAVIGVRSEAFYALQFIELGTAKLPAHPWLLPAFEGTLDQQQERLAAALKERIDRAARSSR